MKSFGLITIFVCLKYTQAITSQCAQAFTSRILYSHNRYRALHGSPDLVNDQRIINIAQNYAQHLASTNSFAHSRASGLGENLAMFSSNMNLGTCEDLADRFTKMWYEEINLYNFNNPGFSSRTGHFTQVVWKSTTSLGCGLGIVGGRAIGVCNYSPPGNVIGAFPRNVLPIGSNGPNIISPSTTTSTTTATTTTTTRPSPNNHNNNCCPCNTAETTTRFVFRPTWNRWGRSQDDNYEYIKQYENLFN